MTAPSPSIQNDGPVALRPPSPRKSLYRVIGKGIQYGLLLTLAFQVVNICCLDNVHSVLPGELYRTAQLRGDELTKIVRRLGIRTLINLRGSCPGMDWYVEESNAAARLNISQEDVCLSAGHLPSVDEIRQLVEVLRRSEPPFLIHCYRGVDRTGLTAMLLLLLKTDTSVAEARRSLSIRYLHLSFGRTGYLDQFADLYENWLSSRELEHTPERFGYWVLHEYRGHQCTGRVEVLGIIVRGQKAMVPVEPDETLATRPNARLRVKVPTGTAFGLRVRFHNTSDQPWRFHPAENVGVHATLRRYSPSGIPGYPLRAGHLHATVPPGESIDVTFPMRPVGAGYREHARIELLDEGHCYFHEVGQPVLNVELEGT